MVSENQNKAKDLFKNKTIALGLTGGIAAYKICLLINKLKREGAQIRLIATENSLNFITKTTLQTLAKTPVLTEQFDIKKYDINHKSLQAESDLFILAPASANTLAKVATGVADNLLTSILCAWQKPLLIAPAMNGGMWYNPTTQQNIETLKKRGAIFVGPQVAKTSDGQTTKGPMADIQTIFESAQDILILKEKLSKKKILIVGGDIKETFDKDHFISSENLNDKAKLIANAAHISGADILFINNETFEAPYPQISVQTKEEYKNAILNHIKDFDTCIFAANLPTWQISKEEKTSEKLVLTLTHEKDFLKEILTKENIKKNIVDIRQEKFDTQNTMQKVFEILQNLK